MWIAITVTPFWFAISLKISQRHTSIANHLQESFMILLSQSVNIKTNNYLVKTMYSLMLIFSVTISMIYSTRLGSFLTKNLDKNTFVIICPQSRIMLLGNHSFQYKIVGFSEYLESFVDMDVRFGYCVSSFLWKNPVPRHKLLFRTVLQWNSTYGHFLRINKNSKHLEDFNSFLFSAYSFGFFEKWSSEVINRKIDRRIPRIELDNNILKFKDLRFPFAMFFIFIVAASFVFWLERLSVTLKG